MSKDVSEMRKVELLLNKLKTHVFFRQDDVAPELGFVDDEEVEHVVEKLHLAPYLSGMSHVSAKMLPLGAENGGSGPKNSKSEPSWRWRQCHRCARWTHRRWNRIFRWI